MNVLVCWFGHETNAFSRKRTDFDLLAAQGYWKDEEIIEVFTGTPSYLGGMIKSASENNVNIIPTFAVENAGPMISKECLESTTNDLISYLRKHQGEFSGICLGLHGAGVAEGCDDVEGYVLSKVREEVGFDIPITVTLDLHANVSAKMCELSDGLFCIKENPHTDYALTGYEAMSTLINSINSGIKYKTDFIKLPLIMPITSSLVGELKEIMDFIKQYKKDYKLVDLALCHGFAYSDNKDVGVTVFVTSKNDVDNLNVLQEVGKHVWDRRSYVNVVTNNEREALDLAEEKLDGNKLVVINEASDNPGAGTPGDGTFLLKELLKRNIKGSAFGYIFDPEFVKECMNVGVGGIINTKLGGKIEEAEFHGEPVDITGEVINISNGEFVATTPLMKNIPGSFGNTVCVKIGNVKVVVASVQNQTYDDRAFFVGNIDVVQQRLLALKSSQHFKAFYNQLDSIIIPSDPMGIATANLKLLPFKNILRPIYPLDEQCGFEEAILFQK